MKKLLLIIVAAVAFTATSHAQGQGEIRLNGGIAFGSEAGLDGGGLGINIGGEYFFTDIISGSPSYTYFFKNSEGDFSVRLGSFNIDGRYYFLTDDIQVYGLAGIGILGVTTKGDYVDPFTGQRQSYSDSDSEVGLNIGGGIVYPFTDQWGFNGQLKYQTPGDGQLVLNAGVSYTLDY